MTFPCKEEYVAFEQLARRQERIYNDAADMGIPLAKVENITTLRAQLKELMSFYRNAFPQHYKAVDICRYKSVEMFIPFEQDGPVLAGVTLSVTFNEDRKVKGGGFISIDIQRASHPVK